MRKRGLKRFEDLRKNFLPFFGSKRLISEEVSRKKHTPVSVNRAATHGYRSEMLPTVVVDPHDARGAVE